MIRFDWEILFGEASHQKEEGDDHHEQTDHYHEGISGRKSLIGRVSMAYNPKGKTRTT
jgi:hypothetical protein